MIAGISDQRMTSILTSMVDALRTHTEHVTAVYAFGEIARDSFDCGFNEVNILVVVDEQANLGSVQEVYDGVLDDLEDQHGMAGASISRSSTRDLITTLDILASEQGQLDSGIRPEWMDVLLDGGILLAGEDIRPRIARPSKAAVEASLEALELPFTFDAVHEIRAANAGLDAFLKSLAYRFRERNLERFDGRILNSRLGYIRRPALEDILRTDVDKYIKKNALTHLYFKGCQPFEGKSSLLKFTLHRCRERGLPVRAWFEDKWGEMDGAAQVEAINSQIKFLTSRKWAVFIFDSAEGIIDIGKILNLIESAGFIAVFAGVSGTEHLPKKENLNVVKLSDHPFPRPELIKNLRNRFQHAGLSYPQSPILAAIVRATGNPFKAGAMAAGMLVEAALRGDLEDDEQTLARVLDAWVGRSRSKQFFRWCTHIADPSPNNL
ncbi:hypothetical protein JW905_09575 [bacterium]|nr:hypothetical protein [candidate division CSSED10-310 bacterium]